MLKIHEETVTVVKRHFVYKGIKFSVDSLNRAKAIKSSRPDGLSQDDYRKIVKEGIKLYQEQYGPMINIKKEEP
jgi:hypothetical protein